MTHEIKTATLAGGLRVPYVEQGDPHGTPLVLLHGYSDSWRSYELLLAALPGEIHAFALTARGHGDADRPLAGYEPEDMAGDVLAFMDAVGLESAVIVGHSGGSYTAQRLAVDCPQRVRGVVLLGTFRTFHDNPVILELVDEVAGLSDPVDRDFVREFQESTVSQPVPADFLERIVAESAKMPARVWRTALDGLVRGAVPTDGRTLEPPVLVVWGDRDEYSPRADQHALVAHAADGRLEIYHGCDHSPHWEQPARVARDILAFIADGASASGARAA